jgi:RNA polymerase sigma factor (sigma-70 family)
VGRQLTMEQRKIVKLRFFEGLTLEAIGFQLGCTKERVRQLVNEAIRAIRKALDRSAVCR